MHASNYTNTTWLHSTSHHKNTRQWFKSLDKYFTLFIYSFFII
jgi:hypothetical protein